MCSTRFSDKLPRVDQVNPDNYIANILFEHSKQTSREPTKMVVYYAFLPKLRTCWLNFINALTRLKISDNYICWEINRDLYIDIKKVLLSWCDILRIYIDKYNMEDYQNHHFFRSYAVSLLHSTEIQAQTIEIPEAKISTRYSRAESIRLKPCS